ncbi:MAG TPA: DNA polymerase IV, partial [candidate division Zixibacteria bacterium]|nr:DNA polymerase IV [candidate division Zixibacteria bacterium]
PMGQALRLCPEAIVIHGNLKQYGYVSAELMKLLAEFTPLVEPFSVDEAFMDVTGSTRLFGAPLSLAGKVKREIRDRLELTCSIGVAPNKILAKMASKLEKPDGLTELDAESFARIYGPLPVGKLWGIGEKTAQALRGLGIATVSDLACFPLSQLERSFGKNALWMNALASGADDSPVYPLDGLPDEKSISHETTFARDSLDREYVCKALLSLSERVARRLRHGDFLARTISIKVRSGDFQTITRDRTLKNPTADQRVIYETARDLLPPQFASSIPVRLVGVKGANLVKPDSGGQLSLFSDPSDKAREKSSRLASAIDALKDKFGDHAIEPAALAPSPED